MSWMAWTGPTALFFCLIAGSLAFLTVLEIRRPTTLAKGWLPMATTRGDRFFISLLTAAFVHLFWLALIPYPAWYASVIALGVAGCILRWG